MFTLTDIGLSQEQLQERVVAHIADMILCSENYDDEGYKSSQESKFKKQIVALVQKRAVDEVQRLAAEHLLPNVTTFLENLCLTQTNQWGEKKGKTLTFVEYLVERAEAYMTEQVDYNGKSKGEETYNWSGKQTRITHLVNSHLDSNIKKAMEEALVTALGAFAKGIHETARMKLNEIAAAIKINVVTK